MHYKKFEDLPVWIKSRIFVNKIYSLINSNNKLNRDFSLCDQIKRASYSIMLNIAEGFERKSNKEFANFINIAKGSAGEVRCILHIMVDNNYIKKEDYDSLVNEIEEISINLSIFGNFLRSHNSKK